jgi:hypothetical protein
MAEETEGTRHDFPFVSRRGAAAAPDQGPEPELAPGDRLKVWSEKLYEPAEETGVAPKGPAIGSVGIVHGRGGDRVPFVAVFTFDDADDFVVVTGDVPREGGVDWQGDGTFKEIDGTGRFRGRRGTRPLHSENPKRWG